MYYDQLLGELCNLNRIYLGEGVKHMDLKSGHLAWPETLKHVKSYSKLYHDLACDVVIIGGGMSGIMMAYELSKQGKHVVLVEKRQIGRGSKSLSFYTCHGIYSCA